MACDWISYQRLMQKSQCLRDNTLTLEFLKWTLPVLHLGMSTAENRDRSQNKYRTTNRVDPDETALYTRIYPVCIHILFGLQG